MQSAGQAPRQFVDSNGARLAYEEAGSGPPLVLVHAGIADSRMWDGQFEELAEHFRVVRYDVRGYGQSAMPAGEYTDRDDLRELFRALGIDRTFVLGVSMGAKIAVDFTIEHPEMVDALVLVSPALGGTTPSTEAQEYMGHIDEVYEGGDLEGAVEMELRWWVDGPNRTPEMVDTTVRERIRRMDTDNFDPPGEEGTELPLDPPAAGRLEEIHVPTLIIVGGGDVPDTLRNADLLEASIPAASKEVIPEAAHMVSMERPEAFKQLVVGFLRG